jgi:hypothetical protein
MTKIWKNFDLPESYKPSEDKGLQEFLLANALSAVRISAAKLRRADTLLIELLLSAAQEWRAREQPFEVIELTSANEEVFMHLGITPDHLCWKVAA